MPTIGVLDDYQDVALSMADWGAIPGGQVTTFTDHLAGERQLVERLQPFEVLVVMRERTPFPRSVLERLPNLRLLVTTGPFNAAIDIAAAAEMGVTVCGTRGLTTPTVEMTWALLLAAARQIPREDSAIRAGIWQQTVGAPLSGRTLGLLGLGRIGSLMVPIANAFGMNVVAWSQNLTTERAEAAGARRVERQELFATSDVVSVHLVLSDRSRGLIGERELRAMKNSALLVNTSRGPLVDESALLRALHDGWIAGAAIDVFEVEPLPADSSLLTAPNLVLSPHLGYVTSDSYRIFYADAVADIVAYLAGVPIRLAAAAPN